jgi:hypothetical protein
VEKAAFAVRPLDMGARDCDRQIDVDDCARTAAEQVASELRDSFEEANRMSTTLKHLAIRIGVKALKRKQGIESPTPAFSGSPIMELKISGPD